MPGKRKPRTRRSSWSQFSCNEDTQGRSDQPLERHQSLQDITTNEQPTLTRSFSSLFKPQHSQSFSDISGQYEIENSDSDKQSTDVELDSCTGDPDSGSSETDDDQLDDEDDDSMPEDEDDIGRSNVQSRSFVIPKEDNTKTKFEESCEHYENIENDEEDILQQEYMKYGLHLPLSEETSHVNKRKKTFYEEFLPPIQLEARLRSNSQRYKRCKVSIQSAHVTRCMNLDVDDELKEIEISGRSKAGKVFDGDIVLVEIFNYEKFTKTVIQRLQRDINKDNRSQRIYGKIVGIFERRKARDIDHPVFVCTLDDTANYLMRPVCRTVPKLHIEHDKQKKYIIKVFKYNTRSSNIEPDYEFRIDPGRKSSYVFLVVYLSWSSLYPMGAVIDVIEVEESFSSAMKIVRLQNQVPEYYKKETIESTRRLLDDLESKSVTKDDTRKDLSHLRVFTIDPEGSQDLDDALSIEKEGDLFIIGIHIADVSVVVKKDDQIDLEARERACTFYPGQGMNAYHMLPEPLSNNVCSLIPGVSKPTLSVMITMSKSGKVLKNCIKKTSIKSCRKYTYAEVQSIINAGYPDKESPEVELQNDILQLFGISKCIRQKRAGTGFFFFPVETKLNDNKDSVVNSKEAHYLVEEFMVLSNTMVAVYLSNIFPKVIPLRCQAAPSPETIQKWKEKNDPFFHMVLRLQNIFLSASRNDEKINLDSIPPLRYTRIMPVQKFVWENVTEALREDNIELAVQYLCMDELHPNQCLALEEWISFQETASYKCSGALKEQKEGMHFSLQRIMYVHFTSPIRRYPDIIVHRLVHAALDRRTCPYSVSEVDLLCQDLNDVIRRAKDFQKQCRMLTWGFKLKQSPHILQGFVQEVTDRNVSLVLPGLRSLPQICREFALNLLHVNEKPTFLKHTKTGDDIMTLKWLLRVYDVSGKPSREERIAQRLHWLSEEARQEVCKRINPHARTKFIKQEKWKEILGLITNEKSQKLKGVFFLETSKPRAPIESKDKREIEDDLHNYREECTDTVLDHSSELENGEVIRQACTFSMSFSRGQVICVQITAEPQKGLLVPSLQMFDMTKNIKHCLQHSRDPIKCFSKYSIHKIKQRYKSSVNYLRIWLPLIEMEAVTNAVRNDSPLINGVDVFMESPDRGFFFLSHYFCEQRDIDFSTMSPHFILVGDDENKNERIENTDFLCIRSEHSTNTGSKDRNMPSADPNYRFQWIIHAQINCIEKIMKPKPQQSDSKESEAKSADERKRNITEKYKINFKTHGESSQATTEMLTAENGYSSCVELVQKSETETRIEAVLKCLDESSKLAKAIALKKKPPKLGETYLSKVQNLNIEDNMPNIEYSNVYQIEAIKNSLNNSFSLIHGPPGTGKTSTGIKLVYLFDLINDMMRADGHNHKQVVFCGPNNKSVDLVAKRTLERFENLDMIRLYGNSLENKDYPIPGKHFTMTSRENRPDPVLKDISVHHLIRQEDSLHAREINGFDDKFRLFRKDKSYWPTIGDIRRYKHITSEAAQEELKKHDIIFCTTAVTTSPRFIKGTRGKVFQLIIDEAGMCTEPESIAAIIATKAKQVVLIGDHKQLSPVICSTHAAELGLQVSLFESYANLAKMLRLQYRMHPEICRFPSNHFYEGKLKTKRSRTWFTKDTFNIWTNKRIPMMFCHVDGEEEYLTVSTDEGNEQSCSNKQEVDQVMRVFEYLVKHEKVNPSMKQAINIMSQYNAQCARIRKVLLDKKYININVNTVVGSQGGEWDYVIFSTARSLPEYRIEKYPTLGWCKQNLGFITDEHQINVALTRARRGLIIIGNKHLLSCDKVWKSLIYHYGRYGCVTDVDHFPPPPPVNRRRRRRRSHRESNQSDMDFYRGTDRELDMVDEENEEE
nr:helicase with zinc finger domain 2-like isoform X2 [Crassostrea virginica]